ncbi:hypothetical protein P4O66_016869, partial [Electrophorus voltai]
AFPKEVKNGQNEQITCNTRQEQGAFWFRVQDDAKFQFIAYLSSTSKKIESDKFRAHQSRDTLTLQRFDKANDSGLYSCVSVNRNKLHFGQAVRLYGEPDPAPTFKPITTVAEPTGLTTTPCVGNSHEVKKSEKAFSVGCEFHILVPLAAGCGLLLILLIITILYCNRLRTRWCPHHCKRRPRNRPAGHTPLPNQHVF